MDRLWTYRWQGMQVSKVFAIFLWASLYIIKVAFVTPVINIQCKLGVIHVYDSARFQLLELKTDLVQNGELKGDTGELQHHFRNPLKIFLKVFLMVVLSWELLFSYISCTYHGFWLLVFSTRTSVCHSMLMTVLCLCVYRTNRNFGVPYSISLHSDLMIYTVLNFVWLWELLKYFLLTGWGNLELETENHLSSPLSPLLPLIGASCKHHTCMSFQKLRTREAVTPCILTLAAATASSLSHKTLIMRVIFEAIKWNSAGAEITNYIWWYIMYDLLSAVPSYRTHKPKQQSFSQWQNRWELTTASPSLCRPFCTLA